MPRSPQRATGEEAYLQIRLPGWLKNEVIDHCETLQVSLNAWLVEAVLAGIRSDLELPPPPPARAPLPTTADMIREWATGQRSIMPCGKAEPCAGLDGDRQWQHDGMGYCGECGIRII